MEQFVPTYETDIYTQGPDGQHYSTNLSYYPTQDTVDWLVQRFGVDHVEMRSATGAPGSPFKTVHADGSEAFIQTLVWANGAREDAYAIASIYTRWASQPFRVQDAQADKYVALVVSSVNS